MKEALKAFYRAASFGPSTNFALKTWTFRVYDHLPPRAAIYDVGGKDARGRYPFGDPPADADFKAIDIAPGPGVDIVADAHDLHMIADASCDCVLLMSVLPHVKRPWEVVAEAHRILRPGGLIAISAAFVYTYSPDPRDYYRFSYEGLEAMCHQFEKVQAGFNRGPFSTMTQMLVHFLALIFSFDNNRLFELNKTFFRYTLFWLKYFDIIFGRYKLAYAIYSGAFFIGRKRAD